MFKVFRMQSTVRGTLASYCSLDAPVSPTLDFKSEKKNRAMPYLDEYWGILKNGELMALEEDPQLKNKSWLDHNFPISPFQTTLFVFENMKKKKIL